MKNCKQILLTCKKIKSGKITPESLDWCAVQSFCKFVSYFLYIYIYTIRVEYMIYIGYIKKYTVKSVKQNLQAYKLTNPYLERISAVYFFPCKFLFYLQKI